MFVVIISTISMGLAQQYSVRRIIHTNPTQYMVTGGGAYCAGNVGVIVGLSDSDPGISYQLNLNGSNIGSPLLGTSIPLSFGYQTLPGIYTVIATNISTGCFIDMFGSATVTVNPIPSVTLTANGPVEFCGNGSVTLTAHTTAFPATYQWQLNEVNISGATGTNYFVNNVEGMYTAIVTSLGCSNSEDTVVQIHPLPQQFTLTASASSFCEESDGVTLMLNGSQIGVSYQLYLNSVAYGVPIGGTNSPLQWMNQEGSGIYSVIATDNITGCTNIMIGAPVITMDPLPDDAISINGQSIVCQYSTAVYSTPPIGGADVYTWSVPANCQILSGQGTTTVTVQFNAATSGTISVFGQNDCGAGQPFILPITVNPAPIVVITTPDAELCFGESTTLTATGTGISWVWVPSGSGQTITITPTSSMTYSVTATGANGCTATDDIDITVHLLPTVDLELDPDQICSDAAPLAPAGGSPLGGIYESGCIVNGMIYPSLFQGTWEITYSYTDPTTNCVNTAQDLFTFNQPPVVNFYSIIGNIYTDTPPFDLTSYVNPSGGVFDGPGMLGSIFQPAVAGIGTHMITYTYIHPISGCSATQMQYITVGTVGIEELVERISIFPNPAKEKLYLEGIDKSIAYIQISGVVGNVYTYNVLDEHMEIDIQKFASGVYFISFVSTDGTAISKKFVKIEY